MKRDRELPILTFTIVNSGHVAERHKQLLTGGSTVNCNVTGSLFFTRRMGNKESNSSPCAYESLYLDCLCRRETISSAIRVTPISKIDKAEPSKISPRSESEKMPTGMVVQPGG